MQKHFQLEICIGKNDQNYISPVQLYQQCTGTQGYLHFHTTCFPSETTGTSYHKFFSRDRLLNRHVNHSTAKTIGLSQSNQLATGTLLGFVKYKRTRITFCSLLSASDRRSVNSSVTWLRSAISDSRASSDCCS